MTTGIGAEPMELDDVIQLERGCPDPHELAALAVVLLGRTAGHEATAPAADRSVLPTWRRRDPAARPAPRSWRRPTG